MKYSDYGNLQLYSYSIELRVSPLYNHVIIMLHMCMYREQLDTHNYYLIFRIVVRDNVYDSSFFKSQFIFVFSLIRMCSHNLYHIHAYTNSFIYIASDTCMQLCFSQYRDYFPVVGSQPPLFPPLHLINMHKRQLSTNKLATYNNVWKKQLYIYIKYCNITCCSVWRREVQWSRFGGRGLEWTDYIFTI